MMATVPHVTSGLGLRKFQADGFLLTRVYKKMFVFRVETGLVSKGSDKQYAEVNVSYGVPHVRKSTF